MNTIRESARVNANADDLWREVGRFGGLANWHPMLETVHVLGTGPGALRTARGKDGSTQVDRLLAIDPKGHTYRYTIERSAMPLRHYSAELHVEPEGAVSRVTWSAQFDVSSGDGEPLKTIEAVRQFFRAGLDALASEHEHDA